jgi:hypothetical protein
MKGCFYILFFLFAANLVGQDMPNLAKAWAFSGHKKIQIKEKDDGWLYRIGANVGDTEELKMLGVAAAIVVAESVSFESCTKRHVKHPCLIVWQYGNTFQYKLKYSCFKTMTLTEIIDIIDRRINPEIKR